MEDVDVDEIDAFTEIKFIEGRVAVEIIFFVMTMISVFLFFRLGESDFYELRTHSGPYGIGVKVFWTKEYNNHTLVYYPISKVEYERSLQSPERYFMRWNLFGR